MSDTDHLIAVEVTGIFPIVSVIGYRDEDEWQFDSGGKPLFDSAGEPVVKKVRVEVTKDVCKPEVAHLDPEKTNIRALVKAGLVRLVPKPAEKPAKKKVKEG